MAALAANSPCLACVFCCEVRLRGSGWCVAVSEPCRELLASAAGQRVQDERLPCLEEEVLSSGHLL